MTRRLERLLRARHLAACYASLDRDNQAHAAAPAVLKRLPKFHIGRFVSVQGSMIAADQQQLSAALRKAGLPD